MSLLLPLFSQFVITNFANIKVTMVTFMLETKITRIITYC